MLRGCPSGGSPATIYFAQGRKIKEVSVKFVGANNAPLQCYVSTPDAPATSFTQWNTICVIPAQPLTPGTKYTLTLKCMVSGVPCARTWHCTTGQ